VVVVLHAPAENAVSIPGKGERIRLPQLEIAGRDDIHMGDDPQGSACIPPGKHGHEVGPLSALHPGIRRGKVAHPVQTDVGEIGEQKVGLVLLSLAAVLRAQCRSGNQLLLKIGNVFPLLVEAGKKLIIHN
jgi:hypothetical protein